MKCVRKLRKGFRCEVFSTKNLLTWLFTNEHKLREYLTASLVSPGLFEAAPNLTSSLHVCWLCYWRETCLSIQVWLFRLDFSVGLLWSLQITTNYCENDTILIRSNMKHLANHLCLGVFLCPCFPPRSMWGWWVHQLPPGKGLHRHNESCGWRKAASPGIHEKYCIHIYIIYNIYILYNIIL